MNAAALVVPGLLGLELVLIGLRLGHVLRWRWWMMTPLWLGLVIFAFEAAAAMTAFVVLRDFMRWLLP